MTREMSKQNPERPILAEVRNPCAYTGAFRAISFDMNSPAPVLCGKLHTLASVFAPETKLMIPHRNF